MSLLSEDREPFRLPPVKAFPAPDNTDFFSFGGSVGPNGENRREDVIKAQVLLGRSGDFDPDGVFKVPTGWPSSDLYRGIRKFQKRNGREADGTLLPVPPGGVDANGVGETLHALRGELGDSVGGQKAPTPSEVDAHYEEDARQAERGAEPSGESTEGTGKTAGPVVSDVPDASQPIWQDGGQSAQMSPLQLQMMQQAGQATQRLLGLPPVTGPGNPPRDRHGVSDDEKKVARELQRRGAETINLLNFAPQLVGSVMRDPQAFLPADGMPKTPPSEPISDGDRAAAQTPPLVPPKVDDKLEGRPAEEHKPDVEKLIPPEMKEWVEELEPFDQALAKELMIVMNRWGDDVTQLGNQEFIKEYLAVFKEEFRHIRGQILHIAGGKDKDGNNLPEEYLKSKKTDGVKGSSYADITFKFVNHITETLYHPRQPGQRNRINTQTMQKRHPDQGIADERRRQANLDENADGQPTGKFPKLRPDMPDGTVSKEFVEAYRAQARAYARENIAEWIKGLEQGGFL